MVNHPREKLSLGPATNPAYHSSVLEIDLNRSSVPTVWHVSSHHKASPASPLPSTHRPTSARILSISYLRALPVFGAARGTFPVVVFFNHGATIFQEAVAGDGVRRERQMNPSVTMMLSDKDMRSGTSVGVMENIL